MLVSSAPHPPRHGLSPEGVCVPAKETGGSAAGRAQGRIGVRLGDMTGAETRGHTTCVTAGSIWALSLVKYQRSVVLGPERRKRLPEAEKGLRTLRPGECYGQRRCSVQACRVCRGHVTHMTGKLEGTLLSSSVLPSCLDERAKAVSAPVWLRMHGARWLQNKS